MVQAESGLSQDLTDMLAALVELDHGYTLFIVDVDVSIYYISG